MMFSRLIHRILPYTKTYYPSRIIRRPLFEKLTRSYSDNAAELPDLCRLRSRGLIEVKGVDAIPFLQGLVTNDVTLLEEQTKCLYTMLLSVQGRVHYDLLLYNIQQSGNEATILLECDHSLIENLIKEIKRYKIRKKVSIEHNESLSVYAKLQQSTHIPVLNSAIIIEATDPRVPQLGSRLIVNEDIESKDESLYHEHRVKLGVPEGPLDLPFGNCLPLESNLVYMNGVSFSKGCYLGQELTARTHHTGVIRKRIMPLVFTEPPPEIGEGENITNEQGKSVGKFRSCVGAHGLGLMRTADVKGELTVKTRSGDSVKLTAVVPDWWPKD